MLVERFSLTSDDVCYCSMPLFHSNAVAACLAPAAAAGATLALAQRFSASGFLADVRRFGARVVLEIGRASEPRCRVVAIVRSIRRPRPHIASSADVEGTSSTP